MATHSYYTLIGSLPNLPRFDTAKRLPITPERLQERLKMLEPEDAGILARVEAFLFWKRQVVQESEDEMARQFDSLMRLHMPEKLKNYLRAVLTQRVVMVWLRRRQRGLPSPHGKTWGFVPLLRHIEKNWADPDFKLAAKYPFVPKARELLAAGNAPALDRHGGLYLWRLAEELIFGDEYGFNGVCGYVFKWSMIAYWMSFDKEKAQKRFEELVAEVCSEYEKWSK